jgi:hypothetical protein
MPTTVAAATTALRDLLDETTAAQWTDVQLRRWLNEGIRDIARRTRHYWDTDTIDTAADDGEYTVAEDVLHIKHVYFTPDGDTSRDIPLEPRAFEAMNQVWWDRQDQSSGYPVFFTTFGYAPTLTIKLFPVPSVDGTLTLHVIRLPAELDVTSGTGNIDVPTGWLEVAYDYAEYKALRKDRDPRWQEAYNLYEAKIQDIIDMGEYINAPGEFIPTTTGMLPNWLVGWEGY